MQQDDPSSSVPPGRPSESAHPADLYDELKRSPGTSASSRGDRSQAGVLLDSCRKIRVRNHFNIFSFIGIVNETIFRINLIAKS